MTVPALPRLGELETAVLEHVWASGPRDVKAVYRAVGAPRGITLNTVQSAMERLFRKGLLAREKVSHAYVYSPRHSREELGARMVEEVVARLLKGEAVPVLAAFVDLAARTDEANLDRLERLVAERKARR
jgi:predicted transcriptional regulator